MPRLQLDVPASITELCNRAIAKGWLREDPDKPWTDQERREAARWFINYVLKEALHRG